LKEAKHRTGKQFLKAPVSCIVAVNFIKRIVKAKIKVILESFMTSPEQSS
jgi:hypothetical protein